MLSSLVFCCALPLFAAENAGLQTAAAQDAKLEITNPHATFGHLVHTRVYAGVGPLPPESPMPSSLADFAAPSMIRRLYIGNTEFSGDAIVAARFMRSVFIGFIPHEATVTAATTSDANKAFCQYISSCAAITLA